MKEIAFLFLVVLCSCTPKNETIKIKGSDTEVNLAVLLAEEFRGVNKDVLVSISGGGSGLGIASLLNGNADIANSSRGMKSDEFKMFEARSIEIDSFIFAQDAIAFVVSDQISIDSISIHLIGKILSGEIDNWSSLTKSNTPITLYGRQSNSGTYDFIKEKLNIDYTPVAKQMNGNAQIIEAIKVDASGIGYVSAGYVLKGSISGIKVLTVYTENSQAVSPLDARAISSGTYYFQRPLYQYFRKNNFNKIKPFLEFEQSQKGANIIQQLGYYPAKP